jgi:hypothetical protein
MSVNIPSNRLTWPASSLDPAKRAKAIRDAIAKKRIKRSKELDEILALLDQIVALGELTAPDHSATIALSRLSD